MAGVGRFIGRGTENAVNARLVHQVVGQVELEL